MVCTKRAEHAKPGGSVGLNVMSFGKLNMPRCGDATVFNKDTIPEQIKQFGAGNRVLDISNEVKIGFSSTGFLRFGHSACRMAKFEDEMGKEAVGKKMEDLHSSSPTRCFTGKTPLWPDHAIRCPVSGP